MGKGKRSPPLIDLLKSNLSGKVVPTSSASKGVSKAMAISYAKFGISDLAVQGRMDLASVAKETEEAVNKASRPNQIS